jgi:hypothetical protein
MTTPPDGPTAEPPAAEPPHEQPAEPPTPPNVPPQPAPAAAYPPPAYGHPAFAPVMRPHEPWINPAKRLQVAVVAAVVALVLLFGGLAVGFAVGHHRGDRGIYGRFDPGFGPARGQGAYPRNFPKGQVPVRPPAPAPSKTG